MDSAGAVGSRESYDPWGEQLSGPALQMGWLGAQQRRADPGTGLVGMGVRSYDAATGRFQSEDPIVAILGKGQTGSRYPYAAGNPVTLYDLGGRCVDAFAMVCEAWDAWTSPGGPTIGNPADMVAPAAEEWQEMVCDTDADDMLCSALDEYRQHGLGAISPGRVKEYFKRCDASKIVGGSALVVASGALGALTIVHTAECMGQTAGLATAACIDMAAKTGSLSLGGMAMGASAVAGAC